MVGWAARTARRVLKRYHSLHARQLVSRVAEIRIFERQIISYVDELARKQTLIILRQTSMPVLMSRACTALLNAAEPRKSITWPSPPRHQPTPFHPEPRGGNSNKGSEPRALHEGEPGQGAMRFVEETCIYAAVREE